MVLSLSVVGEPPSDLFLGQPCFVGKLYLVVLFQVRVLNVVQEPFLENFSLMLLESGTLVFMRLLSL